MLVLARWPATLDNDSQSVRRTDRRVRNVRRNEERLPLTHEMVNYVVAFPNTHFNVPLELVEIFFRIDQMKVVPGVGTLNHHHKKVASILEVPIPHRGLKCFVFRLDPLPDMVGGLTR